MITQSESWKNGITTYEQALVMALIAPSGLQAEIALERASELRAHISDDEADSAQRNAKHVMKELSVMRFEYEDVTDDRLDEYTLYDVWDHLEAFSWQLWDAVASGDFVKIAELGDHVDRMAKVILRLSKSSEKS